MWESLRSERIQDNYVAFLSKTSLYNIKCRLQSLDSKGDQVSDIYTKLKKSCIIRYSDCVKLFEHLSNKCNEMFKSYRPFLSYLKSLFQSEAKCKAIDVKMIFTTKVSHLASF